MFDAAFYKRYYVRPRDARRLARGRAAARPLRLRLRRIPRVHVRRVLDAGCGLGHFRVPVREYFPRARYVGLETQRIPVPPLRLGAGEHRGLRAEGAASTFVICHDVLQYLDDRSAVRALANLGRLSRGALYFSVLTAEDWRRNADRARTDSGVRLRPAAWYKQPAFAAFPARRRGPSGRGEATTPFCGSWNDPGPKGVSRRNRGRSP